MGLLGPSAAEHITGVVFRVGTPGRLAGRCLRPSLSSRKSKATGVVAFPFSSISPLHHLLRFLPSFYSFLLCLLFLSSLSFFPSALISCSVFISLIFSSFHHVFSCRVYVFEFLFARRRAYTCHGRVSYSRIRRNGARVKSRKKQEKVSQSRQFVAFLVLCAPTARMTGSIRRLLFVDYIF